MDEKSGIDDIEGKKERTFDNVLFDEVRGGNSLLSRHLEQGTIRIKHKPSQFRYNEVSRAKR